MRVLVCSLLVCAFCLHAYAQVPSQATADQVNYFRYLLMSLGDPDSTPSTIAAAEASVTRDFQLDKADLAVLQTAAKKFQTTVQSLRSQMDYLISHQGISGASGPAADTLRAQMDSTVAQIANQVLASVRPETAARLRVPGDIVGNAVREGPEFR